jgi:predicted DNA-binding transcriptional regulator YafY
MISSRTIQGDISLMRSSSPRGFSAPIICKGGFYQYSDPEFTIEKTPVSHEEMKLLREAMSLLRQFPGLPQLPALDILLQRLAGQNKDKGLSTSIIQFDTNSYLRGLEWLEPIYNATSQQKVLRIKYHPFLEAPMDIILHPYLLKEWRNRWYIFGRNESDQLWNLAFDRILSMEHAPDIPYLPNDLFDPQTWFNDIIGVTKPDGIPAIDITFQTTLLISHYMETKLLHPSQQVVKRRKDRVVFSLHLMPNQELISEFLRFGRDLQVLSPPEICRMIEERRGGGGRNWLESTNII